MEETDHLCVDLKNKKIATTLVFQGGGAKGVFHVGALQAIEEAIEDDDSPCFELQGYAGTSIGALVAALACVGFKSADMIDEHGNIPLSSNSSASIAENIIGKTGWKKVKFFRDAIRLKYDPRDFSNRNWDALKIILAGLLALVLSIVSLYCVHSYAGLMGVMIYLVALIWGVYHFLRHLLSGIVDLKPFANQLDKILTEKFLSTRNSVNGQRSDRDIEISGLRFSDLFSDGRKLRIVATCISNKELTLFSEEYSKQASVADAVVASMAIPAVVKPMMVEEKQYLDGGIVSNAPSWAFDDLRKIDPDLITISLEIYPRPKESNSISDANSMVAVKKGRDLEADPSKLKFTNIVLAAVFGSQSLGERSSHRLFRHPVYSSKIGLLDFELKPSEIKKSMSDGKYVKKKHILKSFRQVPEIYKDAMDQVAMQFEYEYASCRKNRRISVGAEYVVPQIRVFFAQEMIGARALKIRFSNDGAKPTCDDRLILPIDSSLAGKVHLSKEWELIDADQMQQLYLSGRRDRYRKAMKWSDAKWCLCVSIDEHCGLQSGLPAGVAIVEADLSHAELGMGDTSDQLAWKPIISLIAQVFAKAIHAESQLNGIIFENEEP